jgi:hypothetical protein
MSRNARKHMNSAAAMTEQSLESEGEDPAARPYMCPVWLKAKRNDEKKVVV